MLDKYEKAVIVALLKFLDASEEERSKGILIMESENKPERYLLTNVTYRASDGDMYLFLEDEEDGIVYTKMILRVFDWKKQYMTTVETFATAIKCDME